MKKEDQKRNERSERSDRSVEMKNAEAVPPRTKTNIPTGIDPEIVAVIAAVLEIELKLYEHSRPGRFTFRRRGETGWSEYGRSLLNPYRGENRS